MTAKIPVNRRAALRTAGSATIAAGLLSPFRHFGGVAWAAETPKTYKKWVLNKAVVDGKLSADNFKMLELPIPALEQGKCLIQVKVINIHASTRNRMMNGTTKLGDTDKTNYGCAQVLQSRDKTFKEGDLIACQAGWQSHQVISSEDESIGYGPANEMTIAVNGTKSHWNYVWRPQMVKMWRPDILMDVFGTSGTTAYFGHQDCGPVTPRDAVAISGTTGSVGALAAQLAKAAGAYVVGFGGGPERAKWVVDNLGIDKAFDYRDPDLENKLRAAFPNGIDFYSDGVGGPLSETVAKLMNKNSRYHSYGSSASLYDEDTMRPQTQSTSQGNAPAQGGAPARRQRTSPTIDKILDERNIKYVSWIVHVHYFERFKCEDELSNLLLTNQIKPINTVVKGIENVPQGVMSQYTTNPYGKLQLQFA